MRRRESAAATAAARSAAATRVCVNHPVSGEAAEYPVWM